MEKFLLWFVAAALLTQLIGLYVGMQYIGFMNAGIMPPVVENPAKPSSAVIIFFYIMLMTVFILLVIKFLRRRVFFIRGLELFAVFFSSWLAFDAIIPLGILAAIALVLWRALRPNPVNKALATVFAVVGAGAVIGASLEVVPALIFVVLLSFYDFISVFVTKHMVYMAKAIVESDSAFTLSFPHKFKKTVTVEYGGKPLKTRKHTFQLGGGDILLPLLFSVSVLRQFSLVNALFSIFGSLVALTCLLYYISRRPGRALPALPVVSAGMLAGFIVSLL
jgi:presenilin-like A22 family membrane protease